MEDIYVVILAAGKGKRMDSEDRNKVTLEVNGKPMILRTIDTLKAAGIKNIIVVVGFAKESVTSLLPSDIHTVEQIEQLGTGDAVKVALNKIPSNAKYILVLYGDDSYVYSQEHFQKLYSSHVNSNAFVTFLTTVKDNPEGLGRVVRDSSNQVLEIIENKVAPGDKKKIKEVNLGGFLFKSKFLRESIGEISRNPETGEFYITDMIKIATKQGLAVNALKLENLKWRGVNTKEELEEAQNILNE